MSKIVITIEVPEGTVPDVQYVTDKPATADEVRGAYREDEPPPPREEFQPLNRTPGCPKHGPMVHRAGTNKAGKPYAGFFCDADGCETKPVWDGR